MEKYKIARFDHRIDFKSNIYIKESYSIRPKPFLAYNELSNSGKLHLSKRDTWRCSPRSNGPWKNIK